MSDQPPMNKQTLDYSSSGQRLSLLAVTSLVLGILALLTAIVGIGFIIGLIALVVGVIALDSVTKTPHLLRGRGLARTGMTLGGVAVALAIVMLVLMYIQMMRIVYKGECAANLRGISASIRAYADDNGGDFPVVPYAPYGSANARTSSRTLTGDLKTSERMLFAHPDAEAGSPLVGIWFLAIEGHVNPRQFTCLAQLRSGKSMPASAQAPNGDFYANFQADNQVDYSFAYPYTSDGKVGAWWKANGDVSLPIAADMAPLAGTGKPPSNPAGTGHAANSGNHGGDGQNVAFADGHVEWVRMPHVGHVGDNIYTLSGTATPDPAGKQPPLGPISGHGGAPGAFDILMVPARNLDTGKLW